MSHVQVRPGDWIHIPVPGDPFPVTMSIGDGAAEYAYIEHVEQAGQVKTVAARICPQLPPKRYRLVVGYPGGEVTGTVTVTA